MSIQRGVRAVARMLVHAFLAIAGLTCLPGIAHANTAVRANPTTGVYAADIYWMDWTGYAIANTGGSQNFSFTLADGSNLTLTLTRGGTSTAAVAANIVPTYNGSAMGNAGYCFVLPCGSTTGAPNVALYSTANIGTGLNVSFALSNIVLTNPAGVQVQNFEVVMADAESLDAGDDGTVPASIVFTTTGAPWGLLERVPATGRANVTLTGVGTQTVTQPSGTAPVPAWVLSTAKPATGVFTATAVMNSKAKQGIMLGIRASSITLNKNIVGRSDPSDQFTYSLRNAASASVGSGSGSCIAVGDCTTTGATTGNQIAISAAITVGNTITLQELMAAGSAGTLNSYTKTIQCSNSNTSSPTVLPGGGAAVAYDPASPPTITSQSADDIITCTISNSASANMAASGAATQNVAIGSPVSVVTSCSNSGPNPATMATCTVSGIPASASNISTVCTPTPPANLAVAPAAGSTISCTSTFTPTAVGTVTLTTTAGSNTPDPNTANNTATSTVTVTGIVTANPDSATTPFNTPVTTTVTANDTSSGSPLNPASVTPTQPAHGTVSCDTSGHCTYTPNPTYSGADQYTYSVCDSEPTPVCASTTVSVQVGPHAVNDTATTPQNTPLNGNVSGNDTYPSGSTFAAATNPSHGTVTVNGDGTYTYTPTPGYSGADSFTYTVCEASPFQSLCSTATVNITVGTNTVTATPDSASTAQNTPVTTAVTTNDTSSGAPLNPASVTVTTPPSHGTVVCNTPTAGSCVYTPDTNYSGPDQYSYQVCDTSTPTPVCAITTVSVTVQPNVVTANPDTQNTPQNTPVTSNVLSNDTVSATGAPLNPASVTPTAPSHGTVTCDGSGNCTYTPNSGFSGSDSYTYQVCDTSTPTPVCSSTTVLVTVGANTVTANPDSGTTPYATPVTTNVIGNDTTTGAPLNPASVVVTTQPPNGTVTCTSGSCTYTPNAGFSGQDVYTYQVCDQSTPTPVCAQTTVTLQVGPQAVNDSTSTAQNTAVNGNVSSNDAYPSGSVFSVATDPSHGTVTLNPDGTYTYTPDTNFSGTDTFTYTVCEPTPNQTLCSTATVTVAVNGNAVTAHPDSATTPYATPVTTNVIGNDTTTGAPLNPASVTPTTPPAHGTVACDTSGNCTYTPDTGYSGPDSYTYQVCDTSTPTPACASTTVTVQVGPHAVNDTTSTAQNTPVNGNVSGNDTYPLGSTFTGTAPPSHGTVTVNADGTYTYTPDTNYSGTDTFTYTVCEPSPYQTLCSIATVTISVGQNLPVANPDSATTPQNTPVTTNVIGNDTSNGAPLNPASVTITVPPTHGSVTCDNAGNCTYTPDPNYSGIDQYTYQVCDTSTPTPACSTATVTITVQPNTVTANPDTAATPQNTPVTTPVTANDTVATNGAPLNPGSVTITVPPTSGTVTCNTPTAGSCTYTPDPTYSGTDQYTYQVCDTSTPKPICATATVIVTVGSSTVAAQPDSSTTPYNTAVTTNVIGNDTSSGAPLNPASVTITTQPAHGTVACDAAGRCTYTPTPGYSGSDTYIYKVCDTSTPTPQCGSAVVSIQVGPSAVNDATSTPVNTPVSGSVASNDTYPAGSTFTTASQPSHGTVTLNTNGTYTYTPAPTYSGTDTFTYTVCEAAPFAALCSTATVTITINGSGPNAQPDTAITPYNTPVTSNVLGNDTTTGAPLNPASVTPTVPPQHGTVTCNSSGDCTYTPATGYSGTDTYTYQVCDTTTPTPNCATAVVTVVVGPKANDDTLTTAPGTPKSGNVSGNDIYPAGSTFTVATPPGHGTVTMNPDGTYTYTPATGYSGSDSFTYTVCLPAPNQTVCSTATVTITVTPNAFDPPFITKSAGVVDAQTLLWTIVVDNNRNATAQTTEVRDPLPTGMNFVSGQLACTASGSSQISDCYFDAANNRIVVDAVLTSDLGTANPATAPNRVVISFQAKYTSTPITVTNIASACWDAQDNQANILACTGQVPVTASATVVPTQPQKPVALPMNSGWMLWLMSLVLGGFGVAASRRGKTSEVRRR